MQSFEAELDNLEKNIRAEMVSGSKAPRKLASSWKPGVPLAEVAAGASSGHRSEHRARANAHQQAPVDTLTINGKVRIELTQGDITEESTDAIINSTDDSLDMSKLSTALTTTSI